MKFIGKKGNKELYLGDGKYGPYLKIKGKATENRNITKYLEITQKSVSSFTLEDALHFLRFPKKINDNIIIHLGPYGYYMKYNGTIYNVEQKKDGVYTEEYCLSLI